MVRKQIDNSKFMTLLQVLRKYLKTTNLINLNLSIVKLQEKKSTDSLRRKDNPIDKFGRDINLKTMKIFLKKLIRLTKELRKSKVIRKILISTISLMRLKVFQNMVIIKVKGINPKEAMLNIKTSMKVR